MSNSVRVMPQFGSRSGGGSAGTTNGSPSELIRLWRSRLGTSDTKANDEINNSSQRHRRRRSHHRCVTPPPPHEGVLSQQSKMSEVQDVSPTVDSKENRNAEITRQKSEIDEERENFEKLNALETLKSECVSTPRCDEPKKSFGGAVPEAARTQPASAATTQQQQKQFQQNRPDSRITMSENDYVVLDNCRSFINNSSIRQSGSAYMTKLRLMRLIRFFLKK